MGSRPRRMDAGEREMIARADVALGYRLFRRVQSLVCSATRPRVHASTPAT